MKNAIHFLAAGLIAALSSSAGGEPLAITATAVAAVPARSAEPRQQQRQEPQRAQGQDARDKAARDKAAKDKAAKDKAARDKAAKGQGARDAQGDQAAKEKAAKARRAGNARRAAEGAQDAEGQRATQRAKNAGEEANARQEALRIKNARQQAQGAEAAEAQRIQAAREQAGAAQDGGLPKSRVQSPPEALGTQRIENARDAAQAERVRNAREQAGAAQRIAGARQQFTEQQKAQRIANARQALAGLDDGQSQTAKRFLLEQEKHHQRLARIDRIESLLNASGDTDNLKRVEALRRKENRDFEQFKQTVQRSLNAQQVSAIESTGEVGTRQRKVLGAGEAQKQKLNGAKNVRGSQGE
jgi:hypothetical protein